MVAASDVVVNPSLEIRFTRFSSIAVSFLNQPQGRSGYPEKSPLTLESALPTMQGLSIHLADLSFQPC